MMNVKWFMCCAAIMLFLGAPLRAAEPTAEGEEFFEKKVRPILVEHCFMCHSESAPKLKGGLRLDSGAGVAAGGETGRVVVPGQPDKSKLVEAVHYKNVDLQMPPKGKLPDAAIADLTAWIKMGAPWPGRVEPKALGKEEFSIERRKAAHWAWQPVRDRYPPLVKDDDWPRQNLDRFILGKLEEKGIVPAKPAEPHVLLRRLYFDLIGLPPAVEEIAEFAKQYAATPQAAIEKVVDRLLASPQFGERWARHWLDLVRYGESRGHEFDPSIPNAWQYRDYVIRALNADVPYNQFVMEHLAGDLLPSPRLHPQEKFNESILGTGFWHLGEEVHSPVDIRGDEADRFDNRIDVLTKTFLALTVSCARCHDHKFDAIGTKDYYALYGFLRSSSYRQVRFDTIEHNEQIMKQLAELREKNRGAILRGRLRGTILKALLKTFEPGMDQLDDILKQACASMKSGKRSENELVRFWVTYLEKAAKDENDPFHLVAMLPGKRDDEVREWLKGLAERSARKREEHEASLRKLDVIVDYAKLKPGEWLSDDSSFGPGPVRLGEPCYEAGLPRVIARFQEVVAAEIDPVWRGLKVAPGTQADIGPLGGNFRAGKTLHTPGFTIKTGPVHFLVKGNGKAYAAVDAHTVINGPLHRALVKDFTTAGKWQWITHDLAPYAGQRAHMEFSPNDNNNFAVAMVVQGEKPAPFALESNRFIEMIADPFEATANTVIYRTNAMFFDALWSGEVSADDSFGQEYVRLANWMLDNAGLLGVKNWDKVNEAAKPFLEEQAKLIAQIRTESRLGLALIDGTGTNEHVFLRGSHKAPGEVVPRRFLEALAGAKGIESTGSGRLELARQMTDPAVNPFIARVMVNRVWHHLFGRGIVASTDNFGVLGERPTHPELLDHLAMRFVREGWSIKKLIRELTLTRAYQMTSHPDAAADAADPENLLLHRMRLRRLEGEAIRDAMLQVSGRLDAKMYGPSVNVYLTPFLDGRGRPASGPIDGDGRRSLYIAIRRNFLSPMMMAFDTPSPFSTVGRRTVSNVPAQALILMNDPFVHQMAATWGRKMAAETGTTDERIARMYRQAFTRPPTPIELKDCQAFLDERLKAQTGGAGKADALAWTDLAHVLFNVKEFIFVE